MCTIAKVLRRILHWLCLQQGILIKIIGGSGGDMPGARHPLWDPIPSFLHTFSLKSARVGGPHPP